MLLELVLPSPEDPDIQPRTKGPEGHWVGGGRRSLHGVGPENAII